MNSVRKWIRDLFGFSGNEINGFLILIPIMVALIFSEPVYRRWVSERGEGRLQDSASLDSIARLWAAQGSMSADSKGSELFAFDPNKATVAELADLGFSSISATRIAAYRRKGGVFRVKSDLLKIYGLDSTLYKQLYGFIRLPTTLPAKVSTAPPIRKKWTPQRTIPFDINIADTLQLKSVYGIGSRLAARIVKFREALGGFVSSEQFYEVYGLDSVVVMDLQKVCYIKNGFVPRKININHASEKMLAAHPYIRFKLARLIVSYRFQHGDFPHVNDIKKLSAFGPEEMERVLPYLTTDEDETY